MRNAIVVALLTVAVLGCEGNLYTLPDPPPSSKRRSISLIPGEDERQRRVVDLNARAAVLKLYELLSAKRYVEALDWMSTETRDFLASGDPKGKADNTLASGQLTLPNGRKVAFEPLQLLVAVDVSSLVDSVDGMSESETDRRREFFALRKDRPPRRIVVIKEGNRWVVHRTSIKMQDN